MIHLSVAIGRFFEALLFAVLRVAGMVTGVVLLIALGGGLLFLAARFLLARGRP
ncbi:hypothetical protein [Sphingomonas sp. Leaf412]|uniref:hypothetical protein n=1 Tax=Sphingomonas sp. Leaf412 TaxID=1736370 RepID=UPI000B19652F|nr:hypothetical protein [Sphingomonas sp. Leaf412]